ncbi:MAG: restriction endonuclease, partial [Candidatus Omnitrophica bacterium]|nr:restriction endonuclease [Candidatus Omnitrophota bacterium]
MNKGVLLEQVVSNIERNIQGKDVIIERNKKLQDKVTRRKREHDILLTFKEKHHTVILSIECKQYSRPISVSHIEAFNTKCLHTGIDKGVFVSVNGFSKSSLEKARFLDIACLTLEETLSFPWMLAEGINIFTRKITGIKCVTINTEKRIIREPFSIFHKSGQKVTNNILASNARRVFNT